MGTQGRRAWESRRAVGRGRLDLTRGRTCALWWPLWGGRTAGPEGLESGSRVEGTELAGAGEDGGWARWGLRMAASGRNTKAEPTGPRMGDGRWPVRGGRGRSKLAASTPPTAAHTH